MQSHPDDPAVILANQLPDHWLQHICVVYDGSFVRKGIDWPMYPDEIWVGAYFDGQEYVMLPADLHLRAVFDGLTEIVRDYYRRGGRP